MKALRIALLVNSFVLTLAGLGITLLESAALVSSGEALLPLRVIGMSLCGWGIAVSAMYSLSSFDDRRLFAVCQIVANALLAVMGGMELLLNWRNPLGYALFLIPVGLVVILFWAVTQPQKPEDLAARQAWLLQLSEVAAQEERNRLARDLHDSIKQQLFSINVSTAAAQARWETDPEGARSALDDVRRSAHEAMVEMKALLQQLRPQVLSGTGLIEALREQGNALGYRSGAAVSVELGEPLPDDRMPAGASEALFRIAQEALANVARHARARTVTVHLGREEEMAVLRVEDDGQGFDPATAKSGMGLRNLRERAAAAGGRVEIVARPGAGTQVTALLPLAPAPKTAVFRAVSVSQHLIFQNMYLPLAFSLILLPDRDVWSFLAIWAFLVIGTGWWHVYATLRRTLDPGARFRLRVVGHQTRALLYLAMSLAIRFFVQSARFGQLLGFLVWIAIAFSCLYELHRFHRATEPRRAWPAKFSSWLPFLVLVGSFLAVVGLLFKGPPIFEPEWEQILRLAIGAVVLVYLMLRQPAGEIAR